MAFTLSVIKNHDTYSKASLKFTKWLCNCASDIPSVLPASDADQSSAAPQGPGAPAAADDSSASPHERSEKVEHCVL